MSTPGDISGVTGFLPQRQTPCLARLTRRRPWTGTLALDVGPVCVGVRASTPHAAAAIAARFASAREPELDALAPPTFSLEVGGAEQARGPRPLHVLYRDHVPVARTRTLAEAVELLAEQLTAVCRAGSRSHLAVRSAALVTPTHEVVLVPAEWHPELLTRQRRLSHHELRLLTPDVHLVDRDGCLIRPEAFPESRERRTPVRLWTLRTAGTDGTLRAARAVQLAFGDVVNSRVLGAGTVLRSLAGLSSVVPFRGVALSRDHAVERALSLASSV